MNSDRDFISEFNAISQEFNPGRALSWDNFQERLTLGLFLHAADVRRNLAILSRDKCYIVSRDSDRNLFAFHISGCDQDLSYGDNLIATNDDRREKYYGNVKTVGLTEVVVKMPKQFVLARDGRNVKISFDIRWTPYIIQENCLREAIRLLGERVIFPTRLSHRHRQAEPSNENTRVWCNPQLNLIQKRAIAAVLDTNIRYPVPHLISGPPGTGKTLALVEDVLQIYGHAQNPKILVCAPSNSAANLLLKRIRLGIRSNTEIIRMTSQSHVESGTLPRNLIHYFGKLPSESPSVGMQVISSAAHLKSFQVVVTTVNYCGNFLRMGLKKHFSHLVIDEAGQALETETLIPMCLMDRSNSRIVMFGDEKQLGPVMRYLPLQQLQFDRSTFERLSWTRPYLQQEGNLYSRLLNNYRSIPSILRYYNEMFYENNLIPMITERHSAEFQLVHRLNHLFPEAPRRLEHRGVYFINVNTPCFRVPLTFSRYNNGEKERLVDFYHRLLLEKVPPSDIGIVTPYTAQKQEIMAEIEARRLRLPKVGTVQIFQGEQRMVMLMSAVRSFDEGGCARNNIPLGFVSNPKRINVAISRARALLVIFGNKSVLSGCKNWNKLIQMTDEDRTLIL